MDKKINLNTGEGGIARFETEKIEGNLKAFILKTLEFPPLYVNITSSEGYNLLDLKEFSGIEYYPLRIQGRDKTGKYTNYNNYEYSLNESLIITIQGGKNQPFELIIRNA